MYLANASCCKLYRFGNVCLKLCVRDLIRPSRSSHAPKNLSVDRISKNAPEAFHRSRCLLIDWAALDDRWPWTSSYVAPGRRGVRRGESPFWKRRNLEWLTTLVERYPHLSEVVEVPSQTETSAGPLERLRLSRPCLQCSHDVMGSVSHEPASLPQ